MLRFKWRIVLSGILILIGVLLILFRAEVSRTILKEKKGIREVNSPLFVDTTRREISFIGWVQRDSGWVQHLIYLKGYKWLRGNSAIACSVRLKDFQLCFAQIDFYLWDSLWQRLNSSPEKRVKLLVEGIPAESLVLSDEELELRDFLFLGSPYFDDVALGGGYSACEECPVFDIEKKVLERLFIRSSGKSGYYLNTKKFPKAKSVKITVKIR